MSSWEKFSSEIVEGKKKPALDPVGQEDADINNDGKEDETDSYLKNRRKVRSRIIKKEDYEPLEEKAVSKAQQRFFGMVRAAQKGEMEDPSPEVSKAAASMSKSDVKDFAKTKHAKLPEKKEIKEGLFGKKKPTPTKAVYGGSEAAEKKAKYEKVLKDALPKRAFDQMGREIDPRSGKLKEETSLVDSILENLRAQDLSQAAALRKRKKETDRRQQIRSVTARRAIDDLLKGKVNPAAGTSKRNKVKAPANIKAAGGPPPPPPSGGKPPSGGGDEPDLSTVKGRADERRRASIASQELRRQEDRTKRSGLAAQLRGERTRKKEAAAAAKERAAGRDAAAREAEVKRARELKSAQIDAKEKQKSAFKDAMQKELGDRATAIGSRAAVKQDDTGGQAVRNIDTAGDALAGIGGGIVKGLMAKRQAKKDRMADLKKQREINKAGRSAGKRFDMGKRAESDAKADMEADKDKNLVKFMNQKPPKELTEPYKDGKGRSDVVKAGGIGAEGSVRSKGGSMGADGPKGTAISGTSSKPALPQAKPNTPPVSGGARAIAKVSDVVSKPKSERKFSEKGESLRGKQNRRAKNKKAVELGMGSAKRKNPNPQGFGNKNEGFSNWRAELKENFFLQEVKPLTDDDGKGTASTQHKLIDISKKKNKIEINPALGEGALPVKPIVGSFAQGEAGKGDSNRTMGDVAKRRIRRKLVDWASQKAGEKAEDIVKNILDKKKEGEEVKEGWSDKYKKSIDCDNPKGFSQKAHCAGKKKEVKEAFKDGEMKPQFKKKKGNIQVVDTGNTLKKSVDNQINTDPDLTLIKKKLKEDWQKVNRKDKTDGLSQKAVDAYRRENPGSKLQTAVTEKKPTGKRADRRKSFCRRMKGMKAKLTSKETSRDPDSRINKALRRWNCN